MPAGVYFISTFGWPKMRGLSCLPHCRTSLPEARRVDRRDQPLAALGGSGHSFSSKGNPFWRLLHEAGLTPELLRAEDERRLLRFGVGLTSSAVRATRAAAELTQAEKFKGARRVEALVTQLRPRYVALLGLTLYPVFFPKGTERGPGLKTERLAGATVFVLPNPSVETAPIRASRRSWSGTARSPKWCTGQHRNSGPERPQATERQRQRCGEQREQAQMHRARSAASWRACQPQLVARCSCGLGAAV